MEAFVEVNILHQSDDVSNKVTAKFEPAKRKQLVQAASNLRMLEQYLHVTAWQGGVELRLKQQTDTASASLSQGRSKEGRGGGRWPQIL